MKHLLVNVCRYPYIVSNIITLRGPGAKIKVHLLVDRTHNVDKNDKPARKGQEIDGYVDALS